MILPGIIESEKTGRWALQYRRNCGVMVTILMLLTLLNVGPLIFDSKGFKVTAFNLRIEDGFKEINR